jgi:hypothetical protein
MLSLSLHKGRLSYGRSLQALKREHPALQNMKFLKFFLLWVIFPHLVPDPDSKSRSTGLITKDEVRKS